MVNSLNSQFACIILNSSNINYKSNTMMEKYKIFSLQRIPSSVSIYKMMVTYSIIKPLHFTDHVTT